MASCCNWVWVLFLNIYLGSIGTLVFISWENSPSLYLSLLSPLAPLLSHTQVDKKFLLSCLHLHSSLSSLSPISLLSSPFASISFLSPSLARLRNSLLQQKNFFYSSSFSFLSAFFFSLFFPLSLSHLHGIFPSLATSPLLFHLDNMLINHENTWLLMQIKA